MEFFRDYIFLLPTSLQQPAHLLTSLTARTSSTLGALLDHVAQRPDIASVALLVLLLLVSLQLLKLLYRTVVFWVTLGLRIAFWAGVAALGLWVWTRGLEGAVEDAEGLVEFWGAEYERFSSGRGRAAPTGQWPLGMGAGGGAGRGRAKWR